MLIEFLHKEHGLHVHLVTNQFIDVNRARELATHAGWGRIHVMPMPSEHSGYLAKYLSKERPECLYRWRLWAGFGKGWEWTKVKDVIREHFSAAFIVRVKNGRVGKAVISFLIGWIWCGR
jgi:hypothetical protein